MTSQVSQKPSLPKDSGVFRSRQGNGRPTNDIAKGKYAPVQVAEVAARGNNEAASGRTGDKTAGNFSVDGKEIYVKAPITLADLPELKPQGKVLTTLQDAISGLGTKFLGVMTMRQIADRFPKVDAFKYVKAQELMTTATKKLQSEVAAIDHLFNQFGKDDAAALKVSASCWMLRRTMYHDLPFDHKDNAHLDPVKEDDFNKARAEYEALSDLQENLPGYQSKVCKRPRIANRADLSVSLTSIALRWVMLAKMRVGNAVNLDEVAKVTDEVERKRIKLNTVSQSDRRNLSRLWDDMDKFLRIDRKSWPLFPSDAFW
jgi:hypothetical protein